MTEHQTIRYNVSYVFSIICEKENAFSVISCIPAVLGHSGQLSHSRRTYNFRGWKPVFTIQNELYIALKTIHGGSLYYFSKKNVFLGNILCCTASGVVSSTDSEYYVLFRLRGYDNGRNSDFCLDTWFFG